jgi:putative ABC transport system substrate-binding protein
MKRRVFVPALGAIAVSIAAVPQRVGAQAAPRVPRIGVLRWGTPGDETRPALTAALASLGYQEGRTIHIEWRWATRADVAQTHAVELAGLGLDLIVGSATPAALALRDARVAVPVVFGTVADPVGAGLVPSLARPGGNMTGVSTNLPAMVPKQLQLLREALPGLQRVAFLGSTQDPATRLFAEQAQAAARVLDLRLQVVLLGQASEFDAAAERMVGERVQAVVVQPLFTLAQSAPLAEVLTRRKLASISALRQFADAGGMMTYGPNRADLWRRSASFVDRVLRGAKPANLPIEEPTTYELTLNMATARALGVTIAQAVVVRADAVIQ